MLSRRIIPCLDVKGGRVVKGVRFRDHRDAGDPVELARFMARTEATLSTAQAVTRAVELGDQVAAIAPRRAAHLHDARILEFGIEDDHRNATRFVVLAHQDHEPTGDDRSTILFSTANRPGALLRVLQHFADAGINLTRIESRPARERLGTYLFLIDCDGHRADPALADALQRMDPDLEQLRIIGSYPKAPRP